MPMETKRAIVTMPSKTIMAERVVKADISYSGSVLQTS